MSAPPLYSARSSGFTLIELLAVMLLIITVLAMGVPAMFAAERKSYVNQAMNDLINVHRACVEMQRELAARGIPGSVQLVISNPTTGPVVNVTLPGGAPFTAAQRIGRTIPISINSDSFISRVDATSGSLSWSYDPYSGFIASGATTTLAFKALPSGANYKVVRSLSIYPSGYSEVP